MVRGAADFSLPVYHFPHQKKKNMHYSNAIRFLRQRDGKRLDIWLACNKSGLPIMHGLRIFDALEPKSTPFKFVLCMELTL